MPISVVTGTASGNGLAIARRLAAAGHAVLAIDRSQAAPLDGVESLVGDVCDEALRTRVFDMLCARSEEPVFLINNAGITQPGSPQSDSAWDGTIEVNLKAPFGWAREFQRRVAEGSIRQGGIVFIGSLATQLGFCDNPAYQASKSGVLGLTRAFACDLGRYGIRVNCVSPGYIVTAMTQGSWADADKRADRQRHTLLDRWGEPKDVAGAVAFLCSEEAAYITGINLPVDGGWMACGLR